MADLEINKTFNCQQIYLYGYKKNKYKEINKIPKYNGNK